MELMELPFVFRSRDILTHEERQAEGRRRGEEFLKMLEASDPSHREDYGSVQRVKFTGLEQIGDEFEYSGIVYINRTQGE